MRLIDADALKEKLCILGEHRIERLVEKEPTVDVLEQIRAEIDKQHKWLLQAGYTAYNVDIAFDAIKAVVAEGSE